MLQNKTAKLLFMIIIILFTLTACAKNNVTIDNEITTESPTQSEADKYSDEDMVSETQVTEEAEDKKEDNEHNIKELLEDVFTYSIQKSEVSWSYYPLESYKVIHFGDSDYLDTWGTFSETMNSEECQYIIDTLRATDYELLSEEEVINTDFAIMMEFEDDSAVKITASNQEVYLNLRYKSEWTYAKILSIDLFEYLLGYADEGGIDLDVLSSAESITICYIKDGDKEDYPANGAVTEIEITDAETVQSIAGAAAYQAVPVLTYPSRESADIIFHTESGDYYGKIKFPISTDENGLSEPTIIIQGYYWFSCEELYRILIEFE